MTGLSEVTELVKGHIEAEQVREIASNRPQNWRLEHVIGNAQVDQRCQRLSERLDRVNEVARQVQLAKVGRQVLDHDYLVVRQVEDLQVFETQQLRIHLLNVVLLRVERLEEFEEVLLGANVLIQAKLLDNLAQFQGLI